MQRPCATPAEPRGGHPIVEQALDNPKALCRFRGVAPLRYACGPWGHPVVERVLDNPKALCRFRGVAPLRYACGPRGNPVVERVLDNPQVALSPTPNLQISAG